MSKKWTSHAKFYQEALIYMRRRQKGTSSSYKLPWPKINNAGINGLEYHSITIIGARPGGGKAQPLYSKIYTPKGPVLMKDVKPGMEVLNQKGKAVKVLNIYPQGLKDSYRVYFSDGTFTECCDEHLWKVSSYKQRKSLKNHVYRLKKKRKLPTRKEEFSIVSLKDMIPNLKIQTGKTTYRNYKIPLCEPVEFEKKDILLDPYLLGLIIGDGSISQQTVSITSIDSEIIDFIKSHVEKDSNYYVRQDKITYFLSKVEVNGHVENKYTKALRFYKLMLTKSKNKFIPKDYLYNSKEIRIALLQGLMDSDGYIDIDSKASYTSASIKLAEDVKELCESLGCNASMTKKYNKKYKCFYYTVWIGYQCAFPLFRLTRKLDRCKDKARLSGRYIDRIEYVGKVLQQCIYIDDPEHLYLTDDFIVTHNTVAQDQIIREGFKLNKGQNIRALKFQFEMVGKNSKLREFSAVSKKSYKYLCSAEQEGLKVSDEIINACHDHAKEAAKYPIDIVDKPCTPPELKKIIEDYMKHHATLTKKKLKTGEIKEVLVYQNTVITLDHSVLVKKRKGQSVMDMLNELGEVLTELKKIYPISFIILSQLNRDINNPNRAENGKYGNYILESDIFGADALLQHADMVIGLDRPALRHISEYGPDRYIIEDDSVLVAHILKTRTGDTRMSFLRARFENMRIEEMETPGIVENKKSK